MNEKKHDESAEIVITDLLERIQDDCRVEDIELTKNSDQYHGGYTTLGYTYESTFSTPLTTVHIEIEYHSPSNHPLGEIYD